MPARHNLTNMKPPAAAVRMGTDLARVQVVEDALRHFGMRYLQRIYTEREIAYCGSSPAEMPRRLAARFAAKEACIKVLRPAQRWLDWRSIEVVRQPAGWVGLALHGPARALARRERIAQLSLSLSHEDDYAIAVVAAMVEAGHPSHRPPRKLH
ncbi:holo-ACP synthase [Xylophilus sp.]|uniref:holo-ACP synthase n=1 Tax=Xylophilus sp. TaxID=2653893 RepID=UPI0013BC5830|nr:holo-ACP synthase [Xylophilus sp.]KAF1042293.1 MAG: Holo-[acyl-carrier-protein] synthase [Xylophilus sp.]